jgi:uncharacterized membrane protein YhaH (DUF805 family)
MRGEEQPMMSPQGADFEETSQEWQYGYQNNTSGASEYDDFGPRQKLTYHETSKAPLARQRLTLAIVSLALLVPLTAIVLGAASDVGSSTVLIALGLICLVVMVVNIVFNLYR